MRDRTPTTAGSRPRPHLIPWLAGLVSVGAVAVVATWPRRWIDADAELFGLLALFAVSSSVVRLDVFERARTSPAGIPMLALVFLFGAPGAAAAELGIAAWHLARRGSPLKALYDLGSLTLVAAAAAAVMDVLPGHGRGATLLALLAGSLVYFAANSLALCAIWWLHEGARPLAAFRERLAWVIPHQLACGVIAGAFVIAMQEIGGWAVAAFALPVLMLWIAQKQYVDRSRASVSKLRAQAGELETANADLRRALAANEELIRDMHRSYLSTIESLARTIEAKDPYTGGHTERVAALSLMLARELGFDPDDLRAVQVGAIIHDIGKIGIPDEILLKPGRLTDEEFAAMRRHPEISTYILAELDLPEIVMQMVRHHHERYDGRGYPDGLAGERIPLAARILTVADALDAMISNRPYRAAMTIARARAEIEAGSGSQFCPRVAEALSACLDRDPELALPATGLLGEAAAV